jgi:hypothetical protein
VRRQQHASDEQHVLPHPVRARAPHCPHLVAPNGAGDLAGMRWIEERALLEAGPFPQSAELAQTRADLQTAVLAAVWPIGAKDFSINPESGKKRGMGNGVKPIKDEVMRTLKVQFGWQLEWPSPIGTQGGRATGSIDAVKTLSTGQRYAIEWETGNISSSHRSVNKLALGIIQGVLLGGSLFLPTRDMYRYLTDRVGNFEELSPYFPLWSHLRVPDGYLSVISVQHDRIDATAPRIPKGTDGRALY